MGVSQDKLGQRTISLLEELVAEHQGEKFGAIFVFGYDPEKHGANICSLTGKDFFKDLKVNMYDDDIKDVLYRCMTGKSHDGAILADKEGNILQNDTGLLMHPEIYLKDKGRSGNSISTQFGFDEPVYARHITAKSISHEWGVRVITLSETTGHKRVFENGYTVYSDVASEIEKVSMFRNLYNHLRRKKVS